MNYQQAFRVDGKVALVTGAARGIGAATAEALAQAGASVLITDVNVEQGQATALSLQAAGHRVEFLRHDVCNEGDWEAAIAAIIRQFGGFDILINNAGIETAALLSQCAADDFRRVLEVNVTGVFLGVKHAVRAMSPQGAAGRGGSIVNVASIAGMIGTTGHAAYHTSKGGVRLLTKAAAVECAQLGTGIRVNAVYPGIVRTEMGDNFIKDIVALGLLPDQASAEAAFKAGHPLGFGVPSDVACAVLYLAADAARWLTGTELVLDGGYSAM